MEGIFYTTSRKIRYIFGLVFGLVIVALSIYFEQNGSFGDKKLWFIIALLCGFALSAVMIFLLAGLKRTLSANETQLEYNGKEIQYDDVRSVFPMSAGREGTLFITMKSGKNISVSCLENCSELADFIRLRLSFPEIDAEQTEKELKVLERKSRLVLALLIAVFIVMAVILVLLLIQFYGKGDGDSNRRIVIFAIDELLLSCLLFFVSRKSTRIYSEINEKSIGLRRKKITDMPCEAGCVKILCDPDYRIRISVCKNSKWYAVAEMLTEDGGSAKLDTSELFDTQDELFEAIHADRYIEIGGPN
ncbi:MAG: hypothetical protein J5563_02035 [Clostridia bacterium]|nr:hypothetical protein [Clostridia bacterium]